MKTIARSPGARLIVHNGARAMSYKIDLKGKVCFVAGVADAQGFGWGIVKAFASAGATVIVGTWPPMYKKFLDMIDKGFGEDAILQDGSTLKIDKVYPFDGLYSTVEEVPESVKQHKHYVGLSGYDIKSVAEQVKKDYGKVDYLIHSLANGPEVEKPLLEVSRKGYLGASSSSAYSLIAMVQQFGPFMTSGGSAISISYIAAEKCVPGYGGGMSSAKAALESDTRVLAWEAGRKWGIRINCISAGPAKTRAANAIKKAKDGKPGFIDRTIQFYAANSPLAGRKLKTDDVGTSALALCSDMNAAVTGTILHVDLGMHTMGMAVDSVHIKDFISDHVGHPEWAPAELPEYAGK
eukprot:CAMPEP_0113678526 /NCGR_PEP_ID=MMETSP0038_2-20120614/10015_1 /TAXON_ID=2898 /ORGANISM="Cryptomonas paramecium" /LENGTH=350 /DNA_ID=CAMNT_0000596211 /DNA_START=50 /DNA_END=1102 /DNA_ORIENTATION=- /assembly_acc=CAM_ASM_000170